MVKQDPIFASSALATSEGQSFLKKWVQHMVSLRKKTKKVHKARPPSQAYLDLRQREMRR